MSDTIYFTKEQAERQGELRARQLTARGYPTTVVAIQEVIRKISSRNYDNGTNFSLTDWEYANGEKKVWIVIYSE